MVALRAGHPLLRRTGSAAIQGLNDLPAVIHKGQPGVELCEAHPIFARYGISPRIRLSFDSDSCAIERVVTSDSWTLIPDLVARAHSRQIKVLRPPVDWDAQYSVSLVFRRDREHNPILPTLRRILAGPLASR